MENMADNKTQMPDARRRRVQRLKRGIVVSVLIMLFVPLLLCIVLLLQVQRQSRILNDLSEQMISLQNLVTLQQEEIGRIEEWIDTEGRVAVSGTGTVATGSSANEIQDQVREVLTQETTVESGETFGNDAKHKVYLTFDDGPSCYTDDILDILDEYDVKATFFVVGKETEESLNAMRDIVDRGHSIGMHSYSHKYSQIYQTEEAFEEDFLKIRNLIYDTTGVWSNLYRFPGGSSNTVSRLPMRGFADYLDTQDVTFFDWNVASGDGGSILLSVEKLVRNCTSEIALNGTSMILLHDSAEKRTSVEALPIIIENILALDDTEFLPITEDTEPVQHITR